MNVHFYFCTIIVLTITQLCKAPHTHRTDLNKERVSDGAFSSSKDHYKDGEHHNDFDHEAILGSKDAAEEFDQLPPEEAKKRLRILVDKMDKNKDEYIGQEELTNWVLRSFKALSEEESLERFEEVDVNEDGFVTWKEYVVETYSVLDDDDLLPDGEEYEEEQKMLKEDKEIFKVADTNGDGKLSQEEFVAFTHPEEHDHTVPILYNRIMSEKDSDKDGFINFKEFTAGEGKENNKEWYIVEKEKFDNDYDKDRDGKLKKEEVLLWLTPNNRESAAQEANHLIHSADEDLDGLLSVKEIIDHHDVFVGSEATDYGSHLHDPYKFKDEL